MKERRRRVFIIIFLSLLGFLLSFIQGPTSFQEPPETKVVGFEAGVLGTINETSDQANKVLEELAVKGRAPKTDYKRSHFGQGWEEQVGCDTRNYILKRDLTEVKTISDTDCRVVSGVLNDVYTNKTINFIRGQDTSDDVQIDHIVALSDAWQKGAQNITYEQRVLFANDGLNLLAVDGKTNQDKSDSDSASWLPPNKGYRCQYVARQIAVKQKYKLWITQVEKSSMDRVLSNCPDQKLPIVSQ